MVLQTIIAPRQADRAFFCVINISLLISRLGRSQNWKKNIGKKTYWRIVKLEINGVTTERVESVHNVMDLKDLTCAQRYMVGIIGVCIN